MNALALTLVGSMALPSAEAETPVPSLEECKSIRVSMDAGGWMLDFYADGSGGIGFGSLVMDHDSFPKGTVCFSDLYRTLKPSLRTREQVRASGKPGWIRASIETAAEGKRYKTFFTLNSDVLNQAFRQGLNNADPLFANRIEYLLLHYDPFRRSTDVLINWLPTRTRDETIQQLKPVLKEPAGAYEQIGIYTRMGWKLTINADGSGELSIGRHAGLTSAFPAKTFDFAQTYETHILQPLRESLREHSGKGPVRQHRRQSYISIAAQPAEKPSSLMIPDVNDLTTVKELFERAKAAADPPKEPPPKTQGFPFRQSLDEAWKTHPPVRLPEPSK